MVEQYQSCIDACAACALACDVCAASCLAEPDPRSLVACIALDLECADLCRLAASFMARNSAQALAVCRLCAEACDACAEHCGQHHLWHCLQCAKACQHCAEECRRIQVA